MPRSVEELEVDRVESELLGSSGEVPKVAAEPPIRLGRVGEGAEEVFVPKTRYRFNYRDPERLDPFEARRRRLEGVLAEERRKAESFSPADSVSGRFNPRFSNWRSEASASDYRRYHPSPRASINPRTIFGNEAYTFVSHGLRRHFASPVLAIPCIQRVVRREVMFARRKAGRGYRVPHVRSLLSLIGC